MGDFPVKPTGAAERADELTCPDAGDASQSCSLPPKEQVLECSASNSLDTFVAAAVSSGAATTIVSRTVSTNVHQAATEIWVRKTAEVLRQQADVRGYGSRYSPQSALDQVRAFHPQDATPKYMRQRPGLRYSKAVETVKKGELARVTPWAGEVAFVLGAATGAAGKAFEEYPAYERGTISGGRYATHIATAGAIHGAAGFGGFLATSAFISAFCGPGAPLCFGGAFLVGVGTSYALGTGMRVGELASLPVDCLRSDGTGRRFLKVPLGKLATERLVPFDDQTVELVQRLRQAGRPGRGLGSSRQLVAARRRHRLSVTTVSESGNLCSTRSWHGKSARSKWPVSLHNTYYQTSIGDSNQCPLRSITPP